MSRARIQRRPRVSLQALAVLAFGPCCAPAEGARPPTATGLRLAPVVSGLSEPVHVTAPAGDARLFVVEQGGTIRIVRSGRVVPTPFLDLRAEVSRGYERGLLGLAFHPRFADNGLFFVNYTDRDGDTRIERFTVGADPDRADPSTRRLVLRIEQPYRNHNGGHLVFGPDGMLYVPTGDGGSGGDPQGHGQKLDALLGKLLRIDVDHGAPYAVPPDNPFVGRRDARPEIWAYGLRNPWRVAFDRVANLLFVADVGQDAWEEVNAVAADSAGINYGWNVMEGRHCFGHGDCDRSGLVAPAVEYPHREGCSVTGGEVYRGRLSEIVGCYFYADYCKGWIRSFRLVGGRVRDHVEWDLPRVPVSSFGTDGRGELHVVSHEGTVFRVEAARSTP